MAVTGYPELFGLSFLPKFVETKYLPTWASISSPYEENTRVKSPLPLKLAYNIAQIDNIAGESKILRSILAT